MKTPAVKIIVSDPKKPTLHWSKVAKDLMQAWEESENVHPVHAGAFYLCWDLRTAMQVMKELVTAGLRVMIERGFYDVETHIFTDSSSS